MHFGPGLSRPDCDERFCRFQRIPQALHSSTSSDEETQKVHQEKGRRGIERIKTWFFEERKDWIVSNLDFFVRFF